MEELVDRLNERTNERMNEQTNERINTLEKKCFIICAVKVLSMETSGLYNALALVMGPPCA